jgi:hypothetical protein
MAVQGQNITHQEREQTKDGMHCIGKYVNFQGRRSCWFFLNVAKTFRGWKKRKFSKQEVAERLTALMGWAERSWRALSAVSCFLGESKRPKK